MNVDGTSALSETAKRGNLAAAPTPQRVDSGKSSTATASIYSLIKKRDEATPSRPEDNKKVKFNDSFDDSDDEPERKIPKSAAKRMAQAESAAAYEDTEVVFKKPVDFPSKEDTDSVDDSNSDMVTNDR
ncbi:hypothetical protein ElyMa_006102300 [Elysia marginata]|uniref:Uncharacterized protein n=1 Tax=Elysia marginata TaxID=1093978 RepID=A0AAV4GSN4_9GAST|nr:hypothetical protein ElyMa_006102300 [Elysia marginata]